MKLFKFEGYRVIIEPEALLLKPFRVIWERDKKETKEKAINELGFVYFFADPRSDYQYIVDEDERTKAIKEGEGLPDKWVPDKQVLAAIDFYKQFKTSSVLLLETTRMLVDKLMKQMKGLDLDERDDKNKPIFALNTITATIEKVPGLVVKLDEAEKTIAAELKSDSKMRGQGEKTIFEDNIDI